MALLDTLKDRQDKKYISFWGLVSNIIAVDEDKSDDTYASNETYITAVEALLRLKLHEKIRYFIYNPEDFNFKQIDKPQADEAKIFLKKLLPKSGKKIAPTEVMEIQNQFKNYFWLKESIEQVLPNGIVDFTNPVFFGAGEYRPLEVKPSLVDNEMLIELQRLQEKVNELEAEKSNGSFAMGTPTVAGEDKTYEQLIEALSAANDKIKQQEQDINRLKNQLADQVDKRFYNWQAMDKNQYPPELHLAMEIWKEYYQVADIGFITQFNTGKFNKITNSLKLKDGNLKERMRTLLTPLERKLKAPPLMESLKVIDFIYTDKLEQDQTR